jgi:hypothetical protein
MFRETAIDQPESGNACKPPTGTEVRAMKAAQELFLSSSFKLQVTPKVFFVFVFPVSSLLRYHRSMPSYQTFDQRIHGSHHWRGSSFLFTRIFHLSRLSNRCTLWRRRVLLHKVRSYPTTQGRRKAPIGMERSHLRKLFLSLIPHLHRLEMLTGRFPLRNLRT